MYDVMKRQKTLVSGLVRHVTGGHKTVFTTQKGETWDIDWSAPWKRVDMITELEKATGEKFPPGEQLHTAETNAFLSEYSRSTILSVHHLRPTLEYSTSCWRFIEENCNQPNFHHGPPANDVAAGQVSPRQTRPMRAVLKPLCARRKLQMRTLS